MNKRNIQGTTPSQTG